MAEGDFRVLIYKGLCITMIVAFAGEDKVFAKKTDEVFSYRLIGV